jgi:hypothetical protein
MHRELERLGLRPVQNGVLYISIEQIRQANKSIGDYFFGPGAMRFFSSRVSEIVYCGTGGVYFVTSEQFKGDPASGVAGKPRSYTVRKFNPETCGVDTVGDFNGLTKSKAHTFANKLSKEKIHV